MWTLNGMLGSFTVCMTYVWVDRAVRLWGDHQVDTAVLNTVIGSVATLFPVIVVVGMQMSGSRFPLPCAVLYGLGISTFLFFFLAMLSFSSI